MVRELKSQQVSRFVDVMTVHQEVFPLPDHKYMDIADGRTSGGFADYIAQVAGRIGQLPSAVTD